MKIETSRKNRRSQPTFFELLEPRRLMSVGHPFLPALAQAHPAFHVVAALKHLVKSTPTGSGLTAEYFSNASMTAGSLVRTDSSINFAAKSALSTSLKPAAAAAWTGTIEPATSDNYYFTISANGPVTLTVNGVQLIHTSTAPHGMVRSATPVTLTAGTKYSIVLTYVKGAGTAPSLKLQWAGKHVKQSVVPQSSLFPSGTANVSPVTGGLIGQYFLGNDFQTPVMTRVDPSVNFDFGTSSPNAVIPGHTAYSIRWTGQVTASVTGTYTFSATAANGIRVYVGDSLLIGNWSPHSAQTNTATIALTAGQSYDFRVDYYQNGTGLGSAQVDWALPGGKLQPIPSSAFTSTPAAAAGVLTAYPVSDSQIDLSWTGSSTAAGYNVLQSTDGGATFQTVGTAPAVTTSFTDTGLDPVSDYEFKVVPVGSADTSTPSNVVTAMTLTATPASLNASTVSADSVQLTWENVQGENGFEILAAPKTTTSADSQFSGARTESIRTARFETAEVSGPVFTDVGTAAAGATTFTVTRLLSGTTYQFEIAGINSAGAPSVPTAPADAATTPDAVAGITQTALSPTSMQVSWSPVTGATSYVVQSLPTGDAPWTTIDTVAGSVTSVVDDSVTPGVLNHYRIVAGDAGGMSEPSDPVAAWSPTDAPAGVTATPFSSSLINLSWNDLPNENGFVVLLDQPGTAPVTIATVAPGVLTDAVSGLLPGQAYQFEVESLNAGNIVSAPSAAFGTTTPTIAPLVFTAVGTNPNTAVLNWADVPNETGFTIESAPADTGAWTILATEPAGTTSYTDATLTAGQIRYYRVRADDAGGTSAPSAVASALMAPATPAALLTGLSTAQSRVSWAAVPGAASYDVQRSTNATGTYTDVGTVPGTATSMTVANLLPSTVYYYRVTATNATGASAPSTPVGQMSAPAAIFQQDNRFFGLTSTGGVFNVNENSGLDTLVGQLLPGAYDIRRDPLTNDLYYYVPTNGTNVVYTWDPSTGNNKLFSQIVQNPGVAAFRADGTPFVINTSGQLYSVARSSNVQTLIGTVRTLAGVTVVPQIGNISFNDAGTMYLLNNGTLYTVNETTAVATTLMQVTYGDVFGAFGDNNQFYFTTPTGSTYQLNLNNLVSTLVGTGTQTFTDLAEDPLFDNLGITAVGGATTLTHGTNANYSLTVTNGGPDTEAGPTIITATLPTGFTFVSTAGTNWTSSVSGSTVTMTYSGSILSGGFTPAVTMTVAVGSTALGTKTTTFAAAGQLFNVDELFGTTTATNVVD